MAKLVHEIPQKITKIAQKLNSKTESKVLSTLKE